ncbi:VanZ family protein [Amycolatopsis sp. NPDC059027]|uniref:VanZ family protein n=1 Tax=unclassified Amycolatopsis TaxID=2618356 RepID=UPI0036703982
MSELTFPAIVALFGGGGLALLLAIPYLWWTYRGRGEFGAGHMVLAFGCLVYALALWTYTLLPVPETTPQWCARHVVEPQLRLFHFVDDIRARRGEPGIAGLPGNPALQQVVLNVILFVPLGMFGRHLFRWRSLTTVAIGLLLSLFIETTQLTAVWGVFECPYRLFDVDDLLANTVGAAVGVLLAPALRFVPGQRVTRPPGDARPVTARRRLLGMVLDVFAVFLLGTLLRTGAALLAANGLGSFAGLPGASWLLDYVIPVGVLLLLVPLCGDGATAGQRIVLLAPVRPDGSRPERWRVLPRFAAGGGGFFALDHLGLHFFAAVLAVVAAFLAWRTAGHRGLSGCVAGLRFADSRAVSTGAAAKVARQ